MVLGLIKIGAAQYQRALFEKGEIYMQTHEYFRKLEDINGRGDVLEGAEKIEQLKRVKIKAEGVEITLSKEDGSLARGNVASIKSDYFYNIYSMIGFSSKDIGKIEPIPKKNEDLGDYFILIHNVKEFIRRIRLKLNELQIQHQWGWVTYYDEYELEGEISPFHKSSAFQYQKEVRIVAINEIDEPLKFHIGSIADIAVACRIGQLKTVKLIDDSTFEILT
jgi:hypothetical protein